jgi:ADP-dependent NAD(P)H-hydrate dehydratase / NAD(P)H-hydrate epimerase
MQIRIVHCIQRATDGCNLRGVGVYVCPIFRPIAYLVGIAQLGWDRANSSAFASSRKLDNA